VFSGLKMSKSRKNELWWMALGVSQSGFVVVGCIIGGIWLDRKFGSGPWFSILGLLTGFGAGVSFLYRLVKMSRRDSENHGS